MQTVKMQNVAVIFFSGNNTEFDFRASGAYIFRPSKQEANIFADSGDNVTIFKGPLVSML